MNSMDVSTFFVSEKIAKIRWIPEQLNEPTFFVTGSWNNSYHNKHNIKLWELIKNENTLSKAYYNDDDDEDTANEMLPKCIDKLHIPKDITNLNILNNEKFVVSSADGRLRIINIEKSAEYKSLKISTTSEQLHGNIFGDDVACTDFSIYDQSIATIGEDGVMNILSINQLKLIQKIPFIDNSSLTATLYNNHNEILAANRIGVIRIFDLRTPSNPISNDSSGGNIIGTLVVSVENEMNLNFATALCYHPTQKHIIFAGTDEGSITIWDLRNPMYPAAYLSAHSSSITEMNFDRTHLTKLITASEDGELWEWNHNIKNPDITSITSKMNISSIPDARFTNPDINPWLNGERTKSKINITSLISGVGKSINSFDSCGSRIVCGCDNEAIYYINNMF